VLILPRPLGAFKCVAQQILFAGFGGRKGTTSNVKISSAGVLRLHAPGAVSHDKSVGRSAQDDDFVGSLTKNILNELALIGRCLGASLIGGPDADALAREGPSTSRAGPLRVAKLQ
jgi:hypothetical protein